MKRTESERLFAEAKKYLAGGVNSPVRAYKAVGGTPPFIAYGKGSRIYDVDGNEYIDYVMSWGPLILGHCPEEVVAAVKAAAEGGTSFGAPCRYEVELARLVTQAFPSIERVRMVNSGTEATMSALRLARAFTEREMIVKFEGGYHGHADALLVKAGSGAATFGVPSSPGVPGDVARNTLTLPYNDLKAVQRIFEQEGEKIACIIVEPVAGNMGVIPPAPDFLPGLRELTRQWGALLIFDEVITGFRVAYGGAQELFGIRPDLTCLGKIIGGGLPVGAYGGRKEIMELLAPEGPVYQAGTLAGNPLAMVAGANTLTSLSRPGVYAQLEDMSAYLDREVTKLAKGAGVPLTVNRVGSMLTFFFHPGPVTDFAGAARSDSKRFVQFFWAMLEQGVYLAPSPFEAAFVSTAHTKQDVEETLAACGRAFRLKPSG